MPSDLEVLGHSPVPLAEAYTNEGKWGPYTYSDMTYYTDPTSKGGVFDTGDNNWINSLTPCTGAASGLPRRRGGEDDRQPSLVVRPGAGRGDPAVRPQFEGGHPGGFLSSVVTRQGRRRAR